MTHEERGWGAAPTHGFDALAARFRPIFTRIRERAVERDLERELPRAEIGWLRDAGFSTVRLPRSHGGFGATLPEFFGLLIELSEADPNITNAFRSHFGFSEDLVNAEDSPWREAWLQRLGVERQTIGSGFSEVGDARLGVYSTKLVRDGDVWKVNGEKYYTTGSLYADWIILGAADENDQLVGALVPTGAEGVTILDDWDGFGQALTASGTALFENVSLTPDLLRTTPARFPYSSAFFQLVHLATLAGIGRAAAKDVARLVADRRRVYTRGNALRAAEDPQILQVVGRVRAAAYAAGAIVLKAAEALQRTHEAQLGGDEQALKAASVEAELEVSQAVTVVTSLILDATTALFDALGASAAKRSHGLDRHWRNARTITSHNPRIYHYRNVGEYAVNGEIWHNGGGVGIPGDAM